MFDQLDGPTVPVTQESAFRSKRDARGVRRGVAARGYASKIAAETSLRQTGEEASWRGQFAMVVGVLLMSAIVLGGLEVFERLWANMAMVR